MILLAAAARAQLPMPPKLIRSRPADYPPHMVEQSKDGFMRAQLTVSPAGKLIHCDVILSSGAAELDAAGCQSFAVSRFKPARDDLGEPAFGTVTINIVFLIGGQTLKSPPSTDLSLVVNHMPPGTGPFSPRTAALTVDADGKVRACRSIVEKGTANALDHALCSMAMSRLTFKPALDENGKPVHSIQEFSVEFSDANAPTERTERTPSPHQ